MDYHVWGVMLGRYQKYTPKPSNIAELKTAFLSIWNHLLQSSLIRQSCHFDKDFKHVLLQQVDILNLNIQFKREGS